MTHEIRTDRLLLRPLTPDDAPALAGVLNEWDVVKETEFWSYPVTEERARWLLSRKQDGQGFAILVDGTPIGLIALVRRTGTTYGIGYMIGKAFWGRGYVTEAVSAACRFGFEVLGAERIQADVFQANPASSRVLLKAGFRQVQDPGPGWSATRGASFPRHAYELTERDHT